MTRAPSQLQKCADVGASGRPGVAPEVAGQDLLSAMAEARLVELAGGLEGFAVADLVKSMGEVEVRNLLNAVHASGFVQTMQDASQALARAEDAASRSQ